MTFKKALYLILPVLFVAIVYLIPVYICKDFNPLNWPISLRLYLIVWSAVVALAGLVLASIINDKLVDNALFEEHTHIPFGNGHITFYGKNRPSQEQLEVLEKLKDKVMNVSASSEKQNDKNYPTQCDCENVEIGSYDNQVVLDAPEWSSKNKIGIDVCIADEIIELWKHGIHTTGCCCGHNKVSPMINIEKGYEGAMLQLGYGFTVNEGVFCFTPKTLLKNNSDN